MRNRAAVGWSTAVLAAVYAEWRALHYKHVESTLSAATRLAFRTDTAAGRAVFVGAWAALSAWVVPHILRGHHGHRPKGR